MMDFGFIGFFAAAALLVTSVGLLLSRDWRASIALLALQYFGIFLLTAQSWPVEMAAVKLVSGWISGAVLGMGVLSRKENQPPLPSRSANHGRSFYLLAAVLVILTVLSAVPRVLEPLQGLSQNQAWGGLILLGMGLLQLGFTERPFSTILGLLTFMGGFEVLYAAVEFSTLVAGLLAVVNLALALIGAYLLVAPHMEVEA